MNTLTFKLKNKPKRKSHRKHPTEVIKSVTLKSLSIFWVLWFLVFAKHSAMTPWLILSGFLPKYKAAADPFDSEIRSYVVH